MNEKMVKYTGYQIFHAIFCDNYPTIIHFMFPPYHKVEATQVLNGPPLILSEELLVNPNGLITIPGIEQANMVIWDKDKHTFIKPNELHHK